MKMVMIGYLVINFVFRCYTKIIKLLFLSFIFSNLFIPKIKADESRFDWELERELAKMIKNEIKAKKREKKYKISRKVKKEINSQLFRDSKKNVRKKAYKKRGENPDLDSLADKVFVYKVPAWPFYSLIYQQRGILQVDVVFDFVTQSYSSHGGVQDLSRLLFGQQDMTVKDILLVSRLLKEGKVDPVGGIILANMYFYILADQPLLFDASMNKQTVFVNYARHFSRGDVSWGFQIPIVRRENKLKFNSELSVQTREELDPGAVPRPRTNFFQHYGDLRDFLDDILKEKNIIFNENDTEVGLGDLSTFINFEFDWKRCERLLAGFNFLFPTAKERDTNKLWDPELGNGGFTQLQAFGSILFGESRFFNPHFFAKFTVSLPANVKRRVSKNISETDIPARGTGSANGIMIWGESVQRMVNDTGFKNEPDSLMRRFADAYQNVKIYPNPEFWLRVGNMFERFLFKRAFLDLFYDFRIKGKDYIRHKKDHDQYDYAILTQNTHQIEHRIGLNYSYQFDNHFRFNLGGRFTFSGRNVERLFQLNLALNVEF